MECPILQAGSSPLFIKRRTVRADTLNNSPASGMVYASLVIILSVEKNVNFALVPHDPFTFIRGHTVGTFVA